MNLRWRSIATRRCRTRNLRAGQQKFGERGIMDIIGLIGYYDLVSMTLITMQAKAPNDSVPPLPPLAAK
jgi:4-carboxymuconolactone decarboxylase